MIGWTKEFGGNEGTVPYELQDNSKRLTRIRAGLGVYAGQQSLANVTFTFSNDQGQVASTQAIGVLAGVQPTIDWTVPAGEKITKIQVTYNRYINSLQFQTDKHTISPSFGSTTGPIVDAVGSQKTIRGVRGKSGGVLDSISFYFQ